MSPIPAFTPQTDLIDDADAVDVNAAYTAIEAQAYAAMLADYAHARSVTADLTLTDADNPLQSLAPDNDWDVFLPAPDTANHPFVLIHAGGSNTLTVRDDGDTLTLVTLTPGQVAMLVSDGSDYYVQVTVLDEDDLGSDSETVPPSQQSVKAYVDGQHTSETAASSGTPTPTLPAGFKRHLAVWTAMATDPTYGAPTGATPVDGDALLVWTVDSGSGHTPAWNAAYLTGKAEPPTDAVAAGEQMTALFVYRGGWYCMAAGTFA
jgi:hypothetical protein